ncbi:MAG: peptidyl-prolyl cis-trans isomerase [Pseudomonadota bacterium]
MAKSSSSASKTAVWILLGLLIVSLAGFGATGIGGNIRAVGTVGDKDIGVNQYANALQSDLRALSAQAGQSIPFTTAQQLGLPQQTLSRVVTIRALDHEMGALGLSVGDEFVQQRVLGNEAFLGLDGKFDSANYRYALQQSGLTVTEFEDSLREEATRTLAQGAVLSGNSMPSSYADTVVAFIGEHRTATAARLTVSDLQTEIAVPSDADLQGYYDANIDQYSLPETKEITYAWLSPDMIVDTVEIEEDVLRASYDERSAEFNTPERRLVERLVFPSAEDANAALARVTSGEIDFEALVTERGLKLDDVDMGDVSRDALGAAADSVFAGATGDVVGPADTNLGPALFRINGILAAQNTPFEEARAQLQDELASDRARRIVEQQINDIDDLLAGGATIEELGPETDMEVGKISWSPEMSDGLAAYEAFRTAASAVTTSDFPEVAVLEDGGIFTIRLDEVLAPRPQPFDEVKDRVEAGWQTAETRAALRAQADALLPQITADAGLADLGLETEVIEGISRQGFVDGLPRTAQEALFDANVGDTMVIEDVSTVLILRLDEITPVDPDDADIAAFRDRLTEQAENSLSQDLFDAFASDIQQRAGIYIDQNAINAVHASFQ